MHFSIPDTQELYSADSVANTYTVYNIYINGNYHCCLRYKQLHALHEQLRRRCTELDINLPVFPPKRLLPLTNNQLETRRIGLEHYMQLVGQDVRIAKMEYFQQYLLHAQLATALAEATIEAGSVNDKVEVVLSNGYQMQVNCRVTQNATALLLSVCHALQLNEQMLQYFCLYLMRKGTKELVLLRRLMDFESPFISRLHAQPCQLLVRKCYWNPVWDLKLLKNEIALNLLYWQTVSDIENEWIIATPDVRHKMHSLQEHGLKKEYLEMARQLPLYGCLQFNASVVDYPDHETSALISIGNKELSMRTERGSKIYETKFRVTRMRCWRVSAMHNTHESRDTPTHLQLSFEYLMSKQSLRWITITSSQAMLMSVCLQSMVDELLGSDADDSELSSTPTTTSINGRVSTSSSSTSTPSSSSAIEQLSASTSSSSNYTNYFSNTTTPASPTAPVKFLAQRLTSSKQPNKLTTSNTYSAVFFRNESVQNEAFEGIGDDDL